MERDSCDCNVYFTLSLILVWYLNTLLTMFPLQQLRISLWLCIPHCLLPRCFDREQLETRSRWRGRRRSHQDDESLPRGPSTMVCSLLPHHGSIGNLCLR